MIRIAAAAGLAGTLLLCAAPAAATKLVGDPVAGLQAMRELNLIVLGDMKGSANVEGKAFVGGNLTNGTQFGTGRATQGATPSARPTLTVVGNSSGSAIQLHNGANGPSGKLGEPPALVVGGDLGGAGLNLNAGGASVKVGGSLRNTNGASGSIIEVGGGKSGYLNTNGAKVSLNLGDKFAAPLRGALLAEQAQLEADLKALSEQLAGLEATKGNSTSVFGNRLTFNAVDNGAGVSVFTLDAGIFKFGEFDMKLADPSLTVILNIIGADKVSWRANAIGGLNASLNDNLIWNFAGVENLSIERQTQGSLLAPWADLANRADMEGSIVAKSFRQGGQVHLGTYAGAGFGTAGGVPEPATWAMLIAGFGLVGLAMRRRRPGALASVTA
jgi:choice-of-anchor A domain-containing protein